MTARRNPLGATCFLVALLMSPVLGSAQTISGTLIDQESERPVALGLVLMFTDAGDSIAAVITDEVGRFSVSSPDPGAFVLQARALGYRETPVGVFELGTGASMTVEYRIEPEPIPLDEIFVDLDRPVVNHHLVRNGFVGRYQRGLGHFITPYDIENAIGQYTTEQLMDRIPGVRVRAVTGGGFGLAQPHLGETVQIQSPRGWCTPRIFVDGIRRFYDPSTGLTINTMVDRQAVEAIEVYRRPAEIPVQYGLSSDVTQGDVCGVIVVWSKMGPAAGQVPLTRSARYVDRDGVPSLPRVSQSGPPPEAGENVRLELSPAEASELGIGRTWEGVVMASRHGSLVAYDSIRGRPFSVEAEGINAIQVQRVRTSGFALRRGIIAGTGATAGLGFGLGLLCDWSECAQPAAERWGPAVGVGILVGIVVHSRGPGSHWVATALPDVQGAGGAARFGWRVPAR